MEEKAHLSGLKPTELSAFIESLGEPPYRARQVFAGLHHRRLRSLDELTDLPKELRERLNERATAATLKRWHAPLPAENS